MKILMVLIWVTVVELIAVILMYGVALLFDLRRDPPQWWVRRQVPDHVPSDWGGIDVIDPSIPKGSEFRADLDDPGGDRQQTKPDRRPRS